MAGVGRVRLESFPPCDSQVWLSLKRNGCSDVVPVTVRGLETNIPTRQSGRGPDSFLARAWPPVYLTLRLTDSHFIHSCSLFIRYLANFGTWPIPLKGGVVTPSELEHTMAHLGAACLRCAATTYLHCVFQPNRDDDRTETHQAALRRFP